MTPYAIAGIQMHLSATESNVARMCAKLDLLLNAHTKTCRQRGNQTTCEQTADSDLAPVHQMLFGLHVGGPFL